MDATIWPAQQWNLCTRFTLLDKPASGTLRFNLSTQAGRAKLVLTVAAFTNREKESRNQG